MNSNNQIAPIDIRFMVRMFTPRIYNVVLITLVFFYVIIFSCLTCSLFDRLGYMNFDMGIFDQATYLISHEEEPFVTLRGTHILADHFSVILYLLAPLYVLFPSPKTLLVVQTVALASGVFPVYWLAKEKTGTPFVALIFSVAYLCHPALQWSNTYEFHPDTLATPAFLFALYYLNQKRWIGYFSALLFAALTKENVGLTIFFIGFCLFPHQRNMGVATLITGVATLCIALMTIRYFNGSPSPYVYLYSQWGATPFAVVTHFVLNPKLLLTLFWNNYSYFVFLLTPLLFLPLFAPEKLLPALPAIATNLLSNRSGMHNIEEQYTALITPFFIVAAIAGYERLSYWIHHLAKGYADLICYGVLMNLLLWACGGALLWGPFSRDTESLYSVFSIEEAREIRETLSVIPPTVSVSAQMGLGSQLSQRRFIYHFPNPFSKNVWGGTKQALIEVASIEGATLSADYNSNIARTPVEYIALVPLSSCFPFSFERYMHTITLLLKNPAYGVIAVGKNAIVLRRGANHKSGIQLLARRGDIVTDDSEQALWAWLARSHSPR